jgi:hypothetical protein
MIGLLCGEVKRLSQWRGAVARIRAAYLSAHQRKLNILTPRRFTEKMQWRKLFDMNPVFPVLSDKLAVRSYIASRVGEEFLIPLLWSGDASDIPFDRIEAPFVIKSNHASGHCVMVADAVEVDREGLRLRATKWMAETHGVQHDEIGYVLVPPQIMIEKTVTTDSGERPNEVRLFVFDGKVKVINTVFIESGEVRNGAFHTCDWTRLDWHFSRLLDREFPPPKRLADMIHVAEQLGRDLDHVRIDVYDCGDRIHVGEMTLYSWSGLSRFNPDEADRLLGSFWQLRSPLGRAVASILFNRREISPIAVARLCHALSILGETV